MTLGAGAGDLNAHPNPPLVTEVGISTAAREGAVAEVSARSREKIPLILGRVEETLLGGERVELAAAARSSVSVVWRWRQVSGPEVQIVREANTCHFTAPDVSEPTPLRVGVYASSPGGDNRSDWHFFDLVIQPTPARIRNAEAGGFTPSQKALAGYERGLREVWNDVTPPTFFRGDERHEPELIDYGTVIEDVQWGHGQEDLPLSAPSGGVYIDLDSWEVWQNFGDGYNEKDELVAAPRHKAIWVDPATGDVFEYEE